MNANGENFRQPVFWNPGRSNLEEEQGKVGSPMPRLASAQTSFAQRRPPTPSPPLSRFLIRQSWPDMNDDFQGRPACWHRTKDSCHGRGDLLSRSTNRPLARTPIGARTDAGMDPVPPNQTATENWGRKPCGVISLRNSVRRTLTPESPDRQATRRTGLSVGAMNRAHSTRALLHLGRLFPGWQARSLILHCGRV